MLTYKEKQRLYGVISIAIGEDPFIKTRTGLFNEKTLEVVEKMFAESKRCNENMKNLVTDLLGGSATLAKGWLKKFLRSTKKIVSKSELRGYGCLASVKSRWRTAIISSTI